ncbi:MAG TPA: hypothetical protein ENH94_07895 [Phycisphaerales bacterium]|nr:hypothetical protein [Phycisphaerales bacterium]
MANEFRFRNSDIPREKLKKPAEFIANYSTVLIYEDQPFGSGTFVKCGSRFGILTAYHVPYNTTKPFNFKPHSSDRLGISISNCTHALWIEMQYLNPYSIGVPVDGNYGGPDMVFLEILDQSKIFRIKENQSFWDIPFENGVSMIKKCSTNSDSLWAIAGLPQELQEEKQPEGSFDRVIGLPLQVYFSGIEQQRDACGFDYIELMANYDSKEPMPDSFEGISGGGLWEVPMSIKGKDLKALKIDEPVLSGLQFRQTALKGNSRLLRCHGCKSLNSLFTMVLKEG